MSAARGGAHEPVSVALGKSAARLAAELSAATHDSMLRIAETLSAESGIESIDLPEIARRAEISYATARRHFPDRRALLTEMAANGFQALAKALAQGVAGGGTDLRARYRGEGEAYVRFALNHPGVFRVMFRIDLLDNADPALQEGRRAAFAELIGIIREVAGAPREGPVDPALHGTAMGAWSLVHGFAHLALDGTIDRFSAPRPPGTFPTAMLAEVLNGLPYPPNVRVGAGGPIRSGDAPKMRRPTGRRPG
ncbi:MAG: TetR/AcrR family transcriptional regulator [Alphaproteobacteria bacterium]